MLTLSANDVSFLKALVNGAPVPGSVTGVRDLSGLNNNLGTPTFGTADTPFLRLTEAAYGAPIVTDVNGVPTVTQRDVNPIFAGLDPRAISNVVGVQTPDTPVQSAGANMLFSAFGQYFDHGLTATPKGGSGTLVIGDPGTGRTPGTNNPADLTRATVAGIDAAGVPIHLNNTSAFIDQNQAYGANQLVGIFLRETDGQGGVGAKLASGVPDPSNPVFDLLPTLRMLIQAHWDNDTVFAPGVTFRSYYAGLVSDEGVIDATIAKDLYTNFMGSGQPLLVDMNPFISPLDHIVGGDGRANENVTLTAIHTIWARNHNLHVESLYEAGFVGTAEEVFQAAKIINETEYQRVIYTEFADVLLGGMQGSGAHGHDEYFPQVNAGISQEFAAAAYRFGHSLVGQTVQILDAANQMQSIKLFDAFLNPGNETFTPDQLIALAQRGYVPQPGYQQLGVNSIVAGIAAQPAEEVDAQVVDAIRNDLVRVSADLFALNVARGRDLGLGTLNQVRQSLQQSQDPYVVDSLKRAGFDLNPYTSWEDFQQRNALSDATLAKFRSAYPDLVLDGQQLADFITYNPGVELVNGNTVRGIDRVDLWVGGIAEAHVNGGVVGSTFWVIIHEQLDRLQEADRFYYFDRVKDFDFYEQIKGLGFAGIVARTTGMAYEGDIFTVVTPPGQLPAVDPVPADVLAPEIEVFMPGTGTLGVDKQAHIVVQFSEDVNLGTGRIELRLRTASGEVVESFDVATSTRISVNGNTLTIDPSSDLLGGTRYVLVLTAGVVTDAAGNASEASSSSVFVTDAHVVGTNQADVLAGGEEDDHIDGLAGNDRLSGNDGNDTLIGGGGNDTLTGGAGADRLEGGSGNDVYVIDDRLDTVVENTSSGTDTIQTTLESFTLDIANVENLTFTGTGNFTGNGDAGANVITGGAGADTLNGQAGNDTLAGGAGNDTLTGGAGVDRLTGGGGRDVFVYTSISQSGAAAGTRDLVTDFARGQDLIDLSGISNSFSFIGTAAFTATNQVRYSTVGGQTVIEANTTGSTAADFSIALSSSTTLSAADFVGVNTAPPAPPSPPVTPGLGQTLTGDSKANTLNGRSGHDEIDGRDGNDVLNGAAGNDTLLGGGGNDVLNGGLGLDVLTGGAGSDFFVFNFALGQENVDRITDFSNGNGNNDTIRLENAIFTSLGNGTLSRTAFHTGSEASDESDRIVYDRLTGELFYDADGTGDTQQVLFAILANPIPLTSADFVVI